MPYNRLGDLNTLTLSDKVKCDNPCCILTMDNIVTLMDNFTIENTEANELLATLPSSMRPTYDIILPAYLDDNLVKLTISSMGKISISIEVVTGTLHLNGISFNVCDTYYNNDLGNNYNQGTTDYA